MTELQRLISAVVNFRTKEGQDDDYRMAREISESDLADYLVAHAADIAERERLEANYVRACRVSRTPADNPLGIHQEHVFETRRMLLDYILRHADTDVTP